MNRLVLTVLFVALSALFLGTNAQRSTATPTSTGHTGTAATTDDATTGHTGTAATTDDATTGHTGTVALTHDATTGHAGTAATTHEATTVHADTAAPTHDATTVHASTAATTHEATTVHADTAAPTHDATTGHAGTAAPTHDATTGHAGTAATTHEATTGQTGQTTITPATTTGHSGTMTTPAGTPAGTPAATPAATPTTTPAATPAATPTTTPAATPAATPTTTPAATPAPTTTNNETTPPPPTTTAPPLITNITVVELATPISRNGCGTEQLCAAEPATCNPDEAGSCFFIAAKQTSGRNFEFGLSGESQGYLAASLSTATTAGVNDTTYICANDNGVVKFFSAFLNNGQLTETTLNVNSVRGRIQGNTIQCTFAATVPSASRIRRDIRTSRAQSFSLSVSTGPFNGTSDSNPLGSPTAALRTPVVNLGNPNATTNNLVSATTPSPVTTMSPPIATTSHAAKLQQSMMQALLATAVMLILTAL